MMTSYTVKLTAYNTGFADEADFDAWVDYVQQHIEEECAFGDDVTIDVDAFPFSGRGAGGDHDEIDTDDDEAREAIEEALRTLWDNGCADNFGQASSSATA
jgi:hypothetical protein